MHELTIEDAYLTSFIFSFATDISAELYTITCEDILTGNTTITTGTNSPIIVIDLTVGNTYAFTLNDSTAPLQVVLNPKVYVNPNTILLYPLYNSGGFSNVYTANVASGYYVYDASFQNNATITNRSMFKSLYITDPTSYLSLAPFKTTSTEQTISWSSKSDVSFSFVDGSNNTIHAYTMDVSNQIILRMNEFQQTIDLSVNVADWHYYTWILTENRWQMYVDTRLYDVSGQTPWITTFIDNKIGTVSSTNGYCKDFRMFDYAITEENVVALYLNLGMMIYYTFESYSFNNTYLNFVSNKYDMVFIGKSYIVDIPEHYGRALYIKQIDTVSSYIYSIFSNKVYITADTGFSFIGWYCFISDPGPTNPMFIVNSANYDASGNVINYKNMDGIACMDITGDGKANIYYYAGGNKVFQDTSIILPIEAYTPGVWTYYALTVSTTNVWSVYINGSLCGSVADTSSNIYDTYNIDNAISIATIGVQNDLAVGTPECYYDDMRLYNRVLSVKDIIQLMSEESNLNLPSSNLALWLDATNYLSFQSLINIWTGNVNNVVVVDCSYNYTSPVSMSISANTGKMTYPFPINGSTFFFLFSISEIPTGENQTPFYSLVSPGENSSEGLDIRIDGNLTLNIGYLVKTILNAEEVNPTGPDGPIYPIYDISFTSYYSYPWTNLQANITYVLTIQTNPFCIRINGTTVGTNNGSLPNPIQSLNINANTNLFGPNNLANMNVNEFIYYRSILSTNIYSQIEGYLAWKWYLETELPIDHPFVTAPVIYANANY